MFYTAGQNLGKLNGIKWHYFKGPSYSLHSTTMMIRPLEFWRHSVRRNYENNKEIWRSYQMRNCLKTSEAKYCLPSHNKWQLCEISKVLDYGFGTFWVHKSPCLGFLCSCGLTAENATYCHTLKREEIAQFFLHFKLLLDLILELW